MRPAVHSCNEGSPNHKEPDTCEVVVLVAEINLSDGRLRPTEGHECNPVTSGEMALTWRWDRNSPRITLRSPGVSHVSIPIIGAHRYTIPAVGAGRAGA